MKPSRLLAACLGLALVCLAAPLATQAAPRDIVLMLDNSGSMKDNDPEFLANDAMRAFVRELVGDVHMSILIFDSRVTVATPLTRLDDDTRDELLASLDRVNYKGQLTNSPAALERAMYELNTRGRAEAEKSIIFMTDGIVDVEGGEDVDLEKARWMQTELAQQAADSGIRVFGIAFTDNADFQLIQSLAQKTGARYYRAYTASDVEEVLTSIASALGGGVEVAGGLEETELPALDLRAAGDGEQPKQAGRPSGTAEGSGEIRVEDANILELMDPGGGAPADTESATTADGLPELPDLPELDRGDLAVSSGADEKPEGSTEDPDLDELLKALEVDEQSTVATNVGDDRASDIGSLLDESATKEAKEEPASQSASPQVVEESEGSLVLILAISIGVLALVGIGVAVAFVLRRGKAEGGGEASTTGAYIPQAFINDLHGVTGQKSYELGERISIVGRIAGEDQHVANWIVIDDKTIGRRHAVIEYKNHAYWVIDQSSLNGTFINGERINPQGPLKHGDKVKFYKFEFEFVMPEMFGGGMTVFARGAESDTSADDDKTLVKSAEVVAEEPEPQADDVTDLRGLVAPLEEEETEVRAPQPDDATELNPGER